MRSGLSIVAIALVASCGDRSDLGPGLAPDSSSEETEAGGALEAGGEPRDAACAALTLFFAGCDVERLTECEREYDAFSASTKQDIDAAIACLQTKFSPRAGGGVWPASSADCTPTAVPPTLTTNQAWSHGACQNLTGQVAGDVRPCVGSATACSSLATGCQNQAGCVPLEGGSACTGVATSCSQIAWYDCSGQIGCETMPLPGCGQPGQPTCFFAGTL